jgi:hypothetical protein
VCGAGECVGGVGAEGYEADEGVSRVYCVCDAMGGRVFGVG